MIPYPSSPLLALLEATLGARRTAAILAGVRVPPLPPPTPDRVSRVELSLALALALFEDVCRRVTMASAYVSDLRRSGQKLVLDHGALRTVAAPSGALLPGRAAISRVLEPLGYEPAGTYPLEKLGMTGTAFAHRDLPEAIPQYFVSELHPERFSPGFQRAAARVLASSVDPLPRTSLEVLAELEKEGRLPLERAARLLPNLLACFERQHDHPRLDDYELLVAESPEMAWIATEGQAFNHATDRVEDVEAVAVEQRRLGRPIKEELETSATGRVIQTAFRAQLVERLFADAEGQLVQRSVPGSFHEFIQRGRQADGRLDLNFDSSNAQGIFVMTRVENVG